jgi:hypothetical protein
MFLAVSAVLHEVNFFRCIDFIAHGHVVGCLAYRAYHTNE